MASHPRDSTPLLAAHAPPASSDSRATPKIAAAAFSFAVLGVFQSSIGAVLPLLEESYALSDLHVSLVFLVGPLGYLVAAQMSERVHLRFGRFGIAVLGPALLTIAAALLSLAPRFGLVLAAFAAQGLGTGVLDGSWCAWAGGMDGASSVSGVLHGGFSAGAAGAPVLVALMTGCGRAWFEWYYVLTAASLVVAVALGFAFCADDAAVYRHSLRSEGLDDKPRATAILGFAATWWCAAFFLADVGVETAISGWVVSFMLRSRGASRYLAGLSSSGFWAGMAVGRVLLGPLTDRIGVRKATAMYFATAILVETLFATLPHPVVSVVLMAVLGFSMGPLFPSGVVVLAQLLPKELHVAAVSFVASLGQVGGALLPFGIGAVVERLGIGVFRFAILGQSVLAMALWIAFAKLRRAASTFEQTVAHED